ncbi:signal-transducing adaptor protein 1-like [Myripristis murdjan]|uniref:signal-transducing adaptor protein 1-like n=1 Tax=Myripristis murdjan TaxID=586833 RepID=UPI00117607FC|nr:signal-transducing adaptor protein 1-like [Myripristis murdjan]
MAVPTRVVHKRRAAITDLPLYYSGHLLKKSAGEKDFAKYYGELRGCTIFLYTDDTQDTYTERLELEKLKSPLLDCPHQSKTSNVITLPLRTGEVQLKIDDFKIGEEWRGFILTVTNKEIPSTVQLLPGQKMALEDTLEKEKKRQTPQTRPPLPPRPSHLSSTEPTTSHPSNKDTSDPKMPVCFHDVTRQEAEEMLEKNPEYGSIIIRPSTLPHNYAVTMRQIKPSGPVKKNYRVTATSSGFVIELETPVTVPSLNAVLKYFLEKTEHRLHPYVKSQGYDTRIEVPPLPKCVTIPSKAPKTVPWAQVSPMVQSQEKELLPPVMKAAENNYLVPDAEIAKQGVRQFGSELEAVMRLRRGVMYSSDDE